MRRLSRYLCLADLYQGKRVLEVECGHGHGAHFLANQGAAHVVGIDGSAPHIDEARHLHRLSNLEFRCEDPGAIELEDGSADCIFVVDTGRLLRRRTVLDELRRVLASDGSLILAAPSADRPGAPGGVSFYEFLERLEPLFSPVRMLAQAPFVAMSLVPFADGEESPPEVELDTSLVDGAGHEDGEATDYVAVCGGGVALVLDRGYSIVQVPFADCLADLQADHGPAIDFGAVTESDAAEEPKPEPEPDPGPGPDQVETASELIADALARHAEELLAIEAVAEEHRAYIDELSDELARERVANASTAARLADAERAADQLRAEVSAWRTRASIAEGEVLRLGAAGGEAGAATRLPRADAAAGEELEELRAKLLRVTENWKQAEAKNDDVWRRVGELQTELEQQREDAVANASRQRQSAQLAVTRAVEEASKKLISANDQLLRAQRDNDELERSLERADTARRELEADLEESEDARAVLESCVDADDGGAGSVDGTGPSVSPTSLSKLGDLAAALERRLDSGRGLLRELEEGVRALADSPLEESGRPADERMRELSGELGLKDAELTLLNIGLSSVQDRLREIIQQVIDTRQTMAGHSAGEMLDLMDLLTKRLEEFR